MSNENVVTLRDHMQVRSDVDLLKQIAEQRDRQLEGMQRTLQRGFAKTDAELAEIRGLLIGNAGDNGIRSRVKTLEAKLGHMVDQEAEDRKGRWGATVAIVGGSISLLGVIFQVVWGSSP